MAFKIEKNIDMPAKRGGKGSKYPWDKMVKGDSFFVPGKPKGLYTAASQRGIRISIRPWKKGTQAGVRVWHNGPTANKAAKKK